MTSSTILVEPHASPGPRGARTYMNYMDAARSILIMLGVALHAGNIYAAGTDWLVNDADSRFFLLLTDFLHLFRMPAFFIISGFFCAYTLPRYTPARFLRVRMTRLLVPFLATAVTLNAAQLWISEYVAVEGVRRLPSPLPLSFWFSSGWVYHLWFLLNLIVYSLLVVAVVATPAAKRLIDRFATWLEPRLRPNLVTWLGLVMLPACAIEAIDILAWLVPALHQELLWFGSPMTLLYYAVFFLTGMILCRFRVLLDLFMKPGIGLVALLLAALFTYVMLPRGYSLVAKAEVELAHSVLVMLLCQLVLLLFKVLADRPSRTFQYLAEASYSIYLFHHILVVLAGIALLALPLRPTVEFIIITAGTVTVTLGIHHFVVLRVPLVRFLFNGKYERRPSARARIASAPEGERHPAPALAGAPGKDEAAARTAV